MRQDPGRGGQGDLEAHSRGLPQEWDVTISLSELQEKRKWETKG